MHLRVSFTIAEKTEQILLTLQTMSFHWLWSSILWPIKSRGSAAWERLADLTPSTLTLTVSAEQDGPFWQCLVWHSTTPSSRLSIRPWPPLTSWPQPSCCRCPGGGAGADSPRTQTCDPGRGYSGVHGAAPSGNTLPFICCFHTD